MGWGFEAVGVFSLGGGFGFGVGVSLLGWVWERGQEEAVVGLLVHLYLFCLAREEPSIVWWLFSGSFFGFASCRFDCSCSCYVVTR